jgi:hypothetical protein
MYSSIKNLESRSLTTAKLKFSPNPNKKSREIDLANLSGIDDAALVFLKNSSEVAKFRVNDSGSSIVNVKTWEQKKFEEAVQREYDLIPKAELAKKTSIVKELAEYKAILDEKEKEEFIMEAILGNTVMERLNAIKAPATSATSTEPKVAMSDIQYFVEVCVTLPLSEDNLPRKFVDVDSTQADMANKSLFLHQSPETGYTHPDHKAYEVDENLVYWNEDKWEIGHSHDYRKYPKNIRDALGKIIVFNLNNHIDLGIPDSVSLVARWGS